MVVANFGESAEVTVRIPPEALSWLGVKAVRTVYTVPVEAFSYALVEVL
jgi:hypothetical protein